jgi:HAD superfamily hydrolase (TIGR01459 family)
MTQIIANFATVAHRYDAVLCDLWGCLHNGKTPFPAAVAALIAYRAQGGTVILLTNAPRPKPSIVAQLDAMGVPRDAWDDIVSSGEAAQYAMFAGAVGRKVYHIGAPKDAPFFTELSEDLVQFAATQAPVTRVPLAQAEGIVCTGLADDARETTEDYRAVLLMGKTLGLPMLCANPDIIVDLGDKRMYCAGALAAEYEKMGAKALYFGKPHPPIYDLARRRLIAMGITDEPRLLAIGDGVNTDVQGGMSEGIDTLFVTGGIAADSFGSDVENPDQTLLDRFLDQQMLAATYAIGHLR